jgi:hypothetical protein
VNDANVIVIDVIKKRRRIVRVRRVRIRYFADTVTFDRDFSDADGEREEAAVKERYLGIVKVNTLVLTYTERLVCLSMYLSCSFYLEKT